MKKQTKTNVKRDKSDVILEIFMIIFCAIMFIPIYYLFVTTFKTPADATLHPLGLPKEFVFDNYVKAWKLMNYPNVLKNNIIITLVSVFGIIIISSMAAYTIARRPNKLNKIIYFTLLSGLMIPFSLSIIPLYQIISSMGLMNRLLGVIIIDIFVGLPFATFLFKSFIVTIPYELEEAALIDGCSVFKTYWKITLPLMKPVVATVAILQTLSIWNDFLTPLLFLQSREKGVILQEVYRNVGQFSVDWTGFFPMMVLGILPILIFYIIMQKHIIKGITAGSVKG